MGSVPFLLNAAKITGTVKYEGTIPGFTKQEIKMDADPKCALHHGKPVYPETLVLGDGNTLANVFVHIKSGLPTKTYPTPTTPFVLTQEGCQYKPHVFGVISGQTLKILNPDATLHNIHSLAKKQGNKLNQGMPDDKPLTKVLKDPEFMFKIKCDVHPWMGAYGSVMTHPYFTVTGKDGKFSIDNLPAGSYEVEAWHEKLGAQSATLTVAASDTKTQGFQFTKPKN